MCFQIKGKKNYIRVVSRTPRWGSIGLVIQDGSRMWLEIGVAYKLACIWGQQSV